MRQGQLVSLDDVEAAQRVIAGRLHRTPVTRSTYLGDQLGVRLFFKLEMFQKTGAFKVRGVLNKMGGLGDEEKAKGVIGFSSGNHAQAVAYAAALAGAPSVVVMPAFSIESKIEATKGYGAEVVVTEGSLIETTLAIQKERGLTLVHPFDDPDIIAGAGTVGLEILEDVPDADMVVCGVGGGGLISGVATAVKARRPGAKVYGVEPEGAPGMSRALEAGRPVTLDGVDTIADGLAAPFAGELNLAHVRERVDGMALVGNDDIIEAMRLIMERCKVVAEPAAASTLAALLSGKIPLVQGSTVVCVLSGGNVDAGRLKELL